MLSEERKAFERLSFKAVVVVLTLLAAYWIVPQVWDKLSPFIVAVPLAAMLQPVIRFCFKKLKLKKSISSLILVLLLLALGVFLTVTLPAYRKLLRRINTSVEVEDNGDMSEIDISGEAE